jgi:hypothetical protein
MAEQFNGFEQQDYTLPNGGFLIDADTYTTPEGQKVRIQGINAYETQKIGDSVSSIKQAELGADTQRLFTHKIISDGGFNTPVLTNSKDKYQRTIGDLANSNGELLSDYMLRNGLANTMMPTERQVSVRDVGDLDRAVAKSQGRAPTVGTAMLDVLNAERNQAPFMAKGFTANAKQYGASLDERGQSEYFTGPGVIREEEDYKGEAQSNLSTGWDSGMAQMRQGGWAALGLMGDITNRQDLTNWAAKNVNSIQSDLEDLPYLRNGEAFGEDGKWKLDGFMKTADYLVGTAASSAPQMVVSMGAVALAPFTYGASLALPAVLYTGTTYNAQKEKNPVLAIGSGITQAVVESLALGKVAGSIFSKTTQKEIVDNLVKNGYTKEAAEDALIASTKEAVRDVANAQKLILSQQARRVGVAAATGAATESPTEILQEYVQYVGETGDIQPDTPEGMIKLQNRLMNAGVGGFALGGAFGGGGRLIGNMLTKAPTAESAMGESQFRDTVLAKLGAIPTTEEVIRESLPDVDSNLDDLAKPESNRRSAKGAIQKISDWTKNEGVGSLWKRWSNSIIKEDGTSGIFTGTLATLIGANRAVNGGSIEERQRDVVAQIGAKFMTDTDLRSSFGNMKTSEVMSMLSTKSVQNIVNRIAGHMEVFKQSDMDTILKNLDVAALLPDNLKQHAKGMVKLTTKINDTLQEYNRVTGSSLTMNNFLNQHTINKDKVARSRKEFTSLLQSTLGLTQDQAEEAYLSITDNPHINSLDDMFDPLVNMMNPLINLKAKPQEALNQPGTKEQFSKFLNTDMLSNAASLAGRGGSVYANKYLVGTDGKHLANLLSNAIKEGEITEERASEIAYQLKDWLDMRNGKYHRIDNPYIKGALGLVNFLSTVSSLPLAAISSTVEFAQVYRHLNLPQGLKATKFLLQGGAQEFGKIFELLGKSPKVNSYETSLFQAGLLHGGHIGQRNDVMTDYYRKWTDGFFKMIGLTSITNVTRYAKLGIAADAIGSWLDTVRKTEDHLNPTQSEIDARDHLTRIGIDVDFCTNVSGPMTEEDQQRFTDEMTRGAHSFVAEAVVQPSKLNRPKFYNDPYLQLFTQFTGYVSAFTANVLPLLIKDLQKKGSSDQVNAAATIAMMMALAYLAGYLKDMIKYGESPPEWLKEDKQFQRYIGQVGILGSGQRIWDALSPILEDNQRRSVAGSLWAGLRDQSPALAYLNKVDDALSANENNYISKTVRLMPVFGTSPAFAKELQKVLGE